jgi:M6 family metalloprotease-like protein
MHTFREKRVFLVVAAMAAMGGAALSVRGVPACPGPATATQPDGTVVTIRLEGDERRHWHADPAGYTVVKDSRGWWRYAATNAAGALIHGPGTAGRDRPEALGIPRRLRPSPSAPRRVSGDAAAAASDTNAPSALAAKTGTMRNLVVLVQFADLAATHTAAEYTNLFNQIGYTADGAVGSVKDFYNEVSRNRLNVESVIADWVTLSRNYSYYGGNDPFGNDLRPREMVSEALSLLEARGFDFSQLDADNDGWVDGLCVIHAGGGEEYSGNDPDYIWSHQWQLSSTVTYDGKQMRSYHTEPERRGWDSTPSTWGITRIGVICHETGHFLGLPDLYDTDYSSAGVGDFCLMAGGSWNGDSGTRPSHPSIYCKGVMGWVTAQVVSASGTYTVPRIEDGTNAFRLNGNWPSGQHVLIENRQGYGFDAGLPGTSRGLLVWHIDTSQTDNDNEARFMVDLEEASGTQHLELNQNDGDDADYYRAGNNTQYTAATSPNNLSYEGTALGLDIVAVSASGASMTFTLSGTSPDPVLTLAANLCGDAAGGNTNGWIDPGETIQAFTVWTNTGGSAATGVTAVLSGGGPGVTLLQAATAYPNIASGASASNATPFAFRLAKSVPGGTALSFTNVITAGARAFTGTFARTVGRSVLSTNSLDAAGVPAAIPDLTTIYITNTASLPSPNWLDDVNASVRLDHTYDGDLVLALLHPDSTEVILANQRGGSGNDYGSGSVRTVFDDQAAAPITSGSPPFAGSYRPEGLLSALNGKTANGAWRLRITDAAHTDTGTAIAFGLTLVWHSTQYVVQVYNRAPSASNLSLNARAGLATNLVLRGSDPDGDGIAFLTNSQPAHGTLSGLNTNTGAIVYTAAADYGGTDSFTYVVHDGLTSSAPATVSIAVAPLVLTCTVVSAHGGTWPGTTATNWGAAVSQWLVNSPVAGGAGTQYVGAGASASGNVFTLLAPTNVTLVLTNHATLTWNWQTQVRLTVATNGRGSVSGAAPWYVLGSNAVLTAVPAPDWRFASWFGATGGASAAGAVLTVPMDRGRSLGAQFQPAPRTFLMLR